ncbi:hypothetical protein NECID01_0649 [Nematocida sp. AWRm77]|nr:hypothetical protein NECID01_0649 [Nematocida sp. AWRm77]
MGCKEFKDLLPEEEWLLFRKEEGKRLLQQAKALKDAQTPSAPLGPEIFAHVSALYPASCKVVSAHVLCAVLLELRMEGCTELEACMYKGLCQLGAHSVFASMFAVQKFPEEGWVYGSISDLAGDRRTLAHKNAKRLQKAFAEDIYSEEYKYNEHYKWIFLEHSIDCSEEKNIS